ncbi:uncharacterized protein DS421_2g57690 [Arachis hypogaea]|nr:uncharacterized protein DS421_2g57690 [Arachis hypogaea]
MLLSSFSIRHSPSLQPVAAPPSNSPSSLLIPHAAICVFKLVTPLCPSLGSMRRCLPFSQ